jgi:hypothetical protein
VLSSIGCGFSHSAFTHYLEPPAGSHRLGPALRLRSSPRVP